MSVMSKTAVVVRIWSKLVPCQKCVCRETETQTETQREKREIGFSEGSVALRLGSEQPNNYILPYKLIRL